MSHVDAAMNEMFQATHMQLLRNCCRLEKLVLAAILLQGRAQGERRSVLSALTVFCKGWESVHAAAGHTPVEQLPIVRLRLTYKLPAV